MTEKKNQTTDADEVEQQGKKEDLMQNSGGERGRGKRKK